jgi:rSAM/selenodomain-associated transferase 1
MRNVAIVFARAPRLGAVKRRLARDIGDRAALRFHAGSMRRLLRALARERRFASLVALTPDRAALRLPVRIGRIPQGSGDLGKRMDRAFRRFRRERVVLVGCDILGMGVHDLHAAFRALGRAPSVFGPAEDGGYWLVGMGPRRPARPFAGVRWSTSHALADTRRNFAAHRGLLLRTLRDVDTAADLPAQGKPTVIRCRNG